MMPKWEPDEHGCIYDEAGCFARLTPNKAERLASRHNADCDAYEALIADLEEKLSAYKKYEVGINAFGTLEYLYISDREGAKREDENKSLKSELARVKAESLRMVPDGKQDCVYCGGTDIECIHCYGYGKPVRLERWEEQG